MSFYPCRGGGNNLPSVTYGQIWNDETASTLPKDYDFGIYFGNVQRGGSVTPITIYRISEKAKKIKRLKARIYYHHQNNPNQYLTGKNCTLTNISTEKVGSTITFIVDITNMTGDYSTITIVNGNITVSAGIEIIEAE